jgi:hypothetical protein
MRRAARYPTVRTFRLRDGEMWTRRRRVVLGMSLRRADWFGAYSRSCGTVWALHGPLDR